ncbi:ShlB/FhaC/HecB family hemolysin secretion/activation protein [Kalamiella sp. sgz302252]|uniref:ShlB/FhaC/HecB family hemolysin secretion/activation protein n=1 Tax=Pantoea sp. sgz302252 TaxID=3341827 RepID=UPI0036D234ED
MRTRILTKFIVITVLSYAGYGSAAELNGLPSAAQRNLDRLEREKQQQTIQAEKQRERRIQQSEIEKEKDNTTKGEASRFHFFIKEIVIEDDDKYEFSAQRNAILARYLNTDMGKQEILMLTKELNDFYIGRGYATTQVTIVPGSLRTGKLVMKVLWGKIADFRHNGEAPGWREKMRMFSAMPFAKDKRLNIKDIDQGLDNLLRVSSTDKLLIEPDSQHGYSIINHTENGIFPLSINVGMNNSGYRDAGWYQYYLNTALKNVLGLNDTLTWYYSYNDLNAEDDNQLAKSLSFSLPLGYWLFDTSYYKSNYKKTIGGMYGGYVSDGHAERFSLKASRTLFRDASGKYSGWLKVEKRDNENNIMNFPVAVSSKKYSSLNAGVNWVGGLAGGWGYADLSVTAGVPWFGAAWKQDADLNGFKLDYKKYNGSLNWSRRLSVTESGRLAVDYDFNSGFQYTNDRLVSDAKYSLGDEFSVRGFKEDIVAAERAVWIANTIKIPVQINYARINSIAPFAGFDMGMARHNCFSTSGNCDRDYLTGAAAGIKISGKDFSGSFTAGWPVKKPASLKDSNVDNYALYFNLGLGF